MTIKTDHINKDRSEDPGYWYLWALGFSNTFKALFQQHEEYFDEEHLKQLNIDLEPPRPDSTVMWVIYAQTLELYMKTYLLSKNKVPLKDLRDPKKYGHNLENLRKKCAESEPKFDDKSLTWITQDLRKFTNMDWEYIKYPPKHPPLTKNQKISEINNSPGMYGKETMIPPLELLEKLVKPLVYITD